MESMPLDCGTRFATSQKWKSSTAPSLLGLFFLSQFEEVTHGTHRNLNQRTWRERGTGQKRSRSPFPTRQRKFCGGGFCQGCTACSGPAGGTRGRESERGGGLARRDPGWREWIGTEKARKSGRRISEARL